MYTEAIKAGGLAVVTGAASGVGRAAAERFAQDGLGVVLVDLPGEALETSTRAIKALAQGDAPVKAIPTDVSDPDAMMRLAEKVHELGPVAVLMNNAGIGLRTSCVTGMENWRKMIEVNLFGVLNGVQSFVPGMIEANRPAVVINTGSKQGITTPPGNPGYNVSKAGVKVLTEMLAYELREGGAPVTAHLFVPGFTYTGMIAAFAPEKPPAAWTSLQTVDYLIEGMKHGDFYILCPDNDVTPARDKARVAWAMGDILENRPALSRWHPDFADAFAAHEKKTLK